VVETAEEGAEGAEEEFVSLRQRRKAAAAEPAEVEKHGYY
jgi:hypothetical protein